MLGLVLLLLGSESGEVREVREGGRRPVVVDAVAEGDGRRRRSSKASRAVGPRS
jgi:hypothetical protein